MAKLILSAIFGVDMRNSLLIYICISVLFRLFGLPMPVWPWSLLGILTVANYGLLPDLDLLLYRLIVNNKMKMLHLIGVIACTAVVAVGLWLKIFGFLILALAIGLGWWVAVANAQKVRERGSHWPLLHYPIPVIIVAALYSGLLALQFSPEYFWYAEALTVLPLVAHFAHDCLQEQGFPLFSLTQDMGEHWRIHRLRPFKVRRVPIQITRRFYKSQGAKLYSQTGVEDLQRRADAITTSGIVAFFFLLAASCLEAYLLG